MSETAVLLNEIEFKTKVIIRIKSSKSYNLNFRHPLSLKYKQETED
jgi:hypothetical protein